MSNQPRPIRQTIADAARVCIVDPEQRRDTERLACLIADRVLAFRGEWSATTPGILDLAAARLPGHPAGTGLSAAKRSVRAAEALLADYGITVRVSRPNGQPRRWIFALTSMPTLDTPAA
ncbi:hypothetical protein [Planosporangium mesophilum]|uniref:Uncharacterized protein n=1 Tax=Planosporangium mesophilum TaxID=689768 RepID=A0A8J3WZB7_9ACTN|nr:hypothetical protein [Planosporangium mesophilum]NJC82129.1 hypothetical protein [Planosporangium mesophilum]GII22175.1 hypothetical protein Pme01_17720 [Planosporangium mesophilum]